MSFILVRFVITGCSHNTYSGRQFQLAIPLKVDNEPILVSGVLDCVRQNWPEEFPEMKEQVPFCPVKMLKTGELLTPTNPFSKYLSKKDIDSAVEDESLLDKEGEKSTIIIHLVFQQKTTMQQAVAAAAASRAERSGPKKEVHPAPPVHNHNSRRQPAQEPRARQDRTDDRPQNSGGCCMIM